MVEIHSFTISKNFSKVVTTLLLVMICFVGCSKPISQSDHLTSNDAIVENKIAYVEGWLESTLKKEYSNYVVVQKIEGVFNSNPKKDTYNAYILVSPIDGDVVCHNAVLAIETDTYVHFVTQPDLIPSYADSVYACDVDGDTIEEIIIQQTVGMSGGAGQYLSRIYKIKDNEAIQLFCSSPKKVFDTGFEFVAKDDYRIEVRNKSTRFEKSYNVKDLSDFVSALYDENGKRNENNDSPYIDSFLSFYPVDNDLDGVFELECKQYVALYNHPNLLGVAVSVLKYNQANEKFEVIQADFILDS